MKSCFAKTARGLGMAVSAAVALLLLAGCDESYPADLRYPPRTDPLVMNAPEKELPAPDRPGQLPLFSITDLNDRHNPLHYQTAKDAKKSLVDPGTVPASQRSELDKFLRDNFGTPAEPRVEAPADLQDLLSKARGDLKLEPEVLALGSKYYRQQCLHCHGLTGNGQGPTSRWVNPHPRDYRVGKFKFTSTTQDLGKRRARREDLLRTLREGIEGTSMPSFSLMSEKDLEALVSYVIHLSIRGDVEYSVLRELATTTPQDTVASIAELVLRNSLTYWTEAQEAKNVIRPTPYPYDWSASEGKEFESLRASIQKGQRLFLQPGEASCVSCHPNYGRQSTYRFDEWATMVKPTDLTRGMYRGGRRPVDLYWRIHGGINGSLMASFGKPPLLPADADKDPTKDGIWDLVNFLQVMPYQKMREKYDVKIDRAG